MPRNDETRVDSCKVHFVRIHMREFGFSQTLTLGIQMDCHKESQIYDPVFTGIKHFSGKIFLKPMLRYDQGIV